MKKTIALFLFLVCAFVANAQSGSFEALKGQDKINLFADLSQITIYGYDEERFSIIENDWYKDKQTVIDRFLGSAASKLFPEVIFKSDFSCEYTIRVVLLSITKSNKCTFYYQLEDKDSNVLGTSEKISSSPTITVGTRLKQIKMGAATAGELLGKRLKKMMKQLEKTNK